MRRQWIYLQNPFNTLTIDNNNLAVLISAFHYAALDAAKADAFFNTLYLAYQPVHDNLLVAYDNWKSTGNLKQGVTLTLKQLIALLRSTKIKNWDIAIQNVYEQNSVTYKALLPHRRKQFQNGQHLTRINAVKTLALNIGNDAALASIKADAETFYAQLEVAYNNQKNKKTQTTISSNTLETARTATCNQLYTHLGLLIAHFATNPDEAAAFFDLKNIRTTHQRVFKRNIKPVAIALLTKHTFNADDFITLKNTGNTQLQFYLAHNKTAQPGATFVTLPANTEQTINVTDLGPLQNPFLCVYNLDQLLPGRCQINLDTM